MGSLEEVTVSISSSTTEGRIDLLSAPFGASFRGLTTTNARGERHDIILGYTHKEDKEGGQGDVLIPFPGRVAGGKYTFEGIKHEMEINDKDGPNAIHGFVRLVDWMQDSVSQNEVVYSHILEENSIPGYPFGLKCRITYRVDGLEMTFKYEIQNIGTTDAPVAAGFHPYFTVGDEWIDESVLTLPMQTVLEFNDHLIPTGRVLTLDGSPYDFREPKAIRDLNINHCYCDPIRDADGRINVTLSSLKTGREITVWIDGNIDYIVLYTGDGLPDRTRRRGLAIEPMTCASDGFNHKEWGLITLKPGESCSGQWGIRTSHD